MTTEAAGTARAAVAQALQEMRAQRDEIIATLSKLDEAQLRRPAAWGGTTRSVQFLLRVFSLHEIDHLQHLVRLLRDRDVHLGEAQLILQKAQALRGELEATILSLSDEELEAEGPGDAWSVKRLVEHLRETDAKYFAEARRALSA